MYLYAWVNSFTVHVLRHTESTAKKLGKNKRIKINKTISKQITEDEKLIITTINQTYTFAFINAGDYQRTDLINLLAQHTTNFAAKKHIPSEHSRIITYLKIRARNSGTPLPSFLTLQSRTVSSSTSPKRKRLATPTQRAWTYLADSTLTEGKSKGSGYKSKYMIKGKSKGRGKGHKGRTFVSPKGKHFTKGSIYYANKGVTSPKGKGKSKGNRTYPAIRPAIATSPAHSQVTTVNSSGKGTSSTPPATSPSIRCHFGTKLVIIKIIAGNFKRFATPLHISLNYRKHHGRSSSMIIWRMRSLIQGPAPPHRARITSVTDTVATPPFRRLNFTRRKPTSMNIYSHQWKMLNLTDTLTVRLPLHIVSTSLRKPTGGIISGMVKNIKVNIGTLWSNRMSTKWIT